MAKKTFGNLNQVENMGGLNNLINDPARLAKEASLKERTFIVKTFNIAEDDFAYIKKYVKQRRMSGDTDYTQKEALGEAIGLLRKNTPNLS